MMDRATIFVIDDDAAARDSLRSLLEANGFHVRCFSSAEQFLTECSGESNGCVICDCWIPDGISGLELQEIMAERGICLPVIVCSGYADVSTAVKAMQNGAVTFLEKPCAGDELLHNIAKAFSWSRQRQHGAQTQVELCRRLATLTRREKTVVQKLLEGKLNKVIAKEVGMSLRTVELWRSRAMKKMGANSVAQLVRLVVLAQGDGPGAEVELPHSGGAPVGEARLESTSNQYAM